MGQYSAIFRFLKSVNESLGNHFKMKVFQGAIEGKTYLDFVNKDVLAGTARARCYVMVVLACSNPCTAPVDKVR